MASTLLSPMVDYYNDEEELDSVDEDDDRSFRGRDSEEDTEDASGNRSCQARRGRLRRNQGANVPRQAGLTKKTVAAIAR
ncbi:unnamed protein product, partial [Lampetra planeri]